MIMNLLLTANDLRPLINFQGFMKVKYEEWLGHIIYSCTKSSAKRGSQSTQMYTQPYIVCLNTRMQGLGASNGSFQIT